jgi:Fic family protein
MYQPKYTLTETLLSHVSRVERLYGQIEALRIPQSLEINLARDNLVQSSYASNRIEGNPLTLPEVTNLLLDDRVPVNRSEKEVVNYFSLLKKLPVLQDKPLDLSLMREFHKSLLEGVDATAGQIRNTMVVVGKYKKGEGNATLAVKHNPPYHTRLEIEENLNELMQWAEEKTTVHPIIASGIFHHHFVYLHPFEDGNGRVCRLMTAFILLRRGYNINKYFILDDYYDIDRIQYSDALHSADAGDKTAWLEYFTEGVEHSLRSALFKFENAMKMLARTNRPTPKEQEVLSYIDTNREVTSTDIAKAFHVSRQQAHTLLRNLVDKGILVKKGSTKSSYYSVR